MSDNCHKIQQSSLGKELSIHDCEKLVSIGQFTQLKDTEILFSAGEQTNRLFVILSGKVDVTRDKTAPHYTVIHTLQMGEMAGEMSFIDGETHSLTLRAQGSCELFSIHRDDFEQLISDNPQLTYNVMRAITRSAHIMLKRMNNQFVELSRFINNEYMQAY